MAILAGFCGVSYSKPGWVLADHSVVRLAPEGRKWQNSRNDELGGLHVEDAEDEAPPVPRRRCCCGACDRACRGDRHRGRRADACAAERAGDAAERESP